MIRTIVTIQECYGDMVATVSTHNTADAEQAIRRAVSHRYGKSRGFYEDQGLTRHDTRKHHRFGQVGHGVPRKHGGGIAMDTGNVYIAIQHEGA